MRMASRSWTVREALTTRQFWLLALSSLLSSLVTQSVFAHQVAFFVDHGLEALFASYIVGIVGMVSLGSKILWGTVSDRIGREMTYTMALLLLVWTDHSDPIQCLPFACSDVPLSHLFRDGYASTAALPPLITADLFEGRAYGGILDGS